MVVESVLAVLSIITTLITLISETLPYSKCEGNGIIHCLELKLRRLREATERAQVNSEN